MLTDRQIKSLKTDRLQVDVLDGTSPASVSASPTRPARASSSSIAPGASRTHTADSTESPLEPYPYLSLGEARERARAILREVEMGKDPGTGLARQHVQRRPKNRQGAAVAADPRLQKLFP